MRLSPLTLRPFVVAFVLVLTAAGSLAVSSDVAAVGTFDSGISGIVTQRACLFVPRPCTPSSRPMYVQVASAADRHVVVTVRPRIFRFHIALRPGRYFVRLIREATAIGSGGQLVYVRAHAYTPLALRG